jgi:hypothetical protein
MVANTCNPSTLRRLRLRSLRPALATQQDPVERERERGEREGRREQRKEGGKKRRKERRRKEMNTS